MKNSGIILKTIYIGLISCVLFFGCKESKPQSEIECFFKKSLHFTTDGMRYWYEKEGGFKDITNISYDKLDCKNCHVKGCDTCHAEKKGNYLLYSVKKSKDMGICLNCHSREKVTFAIGKKTKTLDVHIANGMTCVDCHSGSDIHGDGNLYKSMRDTGAVKASCDNCHKGEISKTRSHTVHKGKLDCASCHVKNSTTCLNCHFDNFLKTGKRKGNFIPPTQEWMILINYKGKVTSGNVQTLVYDDNKFIAYAPYFTHAVQGKGKQCKECHANKAVRLMEKGKNIPMMSFKDGKIEQWKGVVPLIADRLEWIFLNKKDDKWVPIENKRSVKVQYSEYGEPLTDDQLKRLASPVK
ncbi:MAG: hypothetical protein SVR08_03110 [Spirochaetota bacterium]|nr:hypothetical protein [Spirochaetota bacterium]